MTLVKDIKKEYTRIMRCRKGESRDLARRYASGAYLALELGLEKRTIRAMERSISSYQDGLIATTDRIEYFSIQEEQGLVKYLPECHQHKSKYWDSSDEKLYVEKMHDFLSCLRKEIKPDSLEFIAEQKGWVVILRQSFDGWPSDPGEMKKLFGRLVSYKKKTKNLPDVDFPYISWGIDLTYDSVLGSCSGGPVYYGFGLKHPNLFKKRYEKMRKILKANPSNKLINEWIKMKHSHGNSADMGTILNIIGYKRRPTQNDIN